MKDYYRLTSTQKKEIAQNLIDILDNDIVPSDETITFIGNWILTGREKKFKAYYDVWEMVLKSFMPITRPILIRSIKRKSTHEYIGSFTNSAFTAQKFSQGKGYWIIYDAKEFLEIIEKTYKKGEYIYTFYPITEVLKKAKANGGWGFSEYLLDHYTGEDEYIMKIDFSVMQLLKYIDQKFLK